MTPAKFLDLSIQNADNSYFICGECGLQLQQIFHCANNNYEFVQYKKNNMYEFIALILIEYFKISYQTVHETKCK